ncbi:MAG: polyprenol monophosphomannose synthase [Acidobacteria bacterium]|nr:polyprenol monophosphomannose synthase [Acidobacteriota bacterium]
MPVPDAGHAPPAGWPGRAPRAIVVVPTYNERQNLPGLVERLMAHEGVRVLVVDDRSPDGTGQIAEELAVRFPGRVGVLHRVEARGYGRSCLDGLRRALAEPVDVVCQMDADLSHDPDDLPAIVAAAGAADMVIGSRYVAGGRVVNWPLRRRLLSRVANMYIRLVTRLGARDCTSGYRCWRREALAAVPFDEVFSDGYSFLVEMLFRTARLGQRIAEVPITFVERREGESKLSAAVLVESVITPWRLAAARHAGRRRVRANF